MDIREASIIKYDEIRNAFKDNNTDIFPGNQLEEAKEFQKPVLGKYPKPYGRYVPLLSAYWLYFDDSWWYIVHDMITFYQIFSRYISHVPYNNIFNDEELTSMYMDFWNYQPEFFQSKFHNHKNSNKHWHLPEAWPVKMPIEAVKYAEDNGIIPVIFDLSNIDHDAYIDLDVIELDKLNNNENSKKTSKKGKIIAGIFVGTLVIGGSIYVWSKLND